VHGIDEIPTGMRMDEIPAGIDRAFSVDHISRIFCVPPWLIDPTVPVPPRFSRERLRWRLIERRAWLKECLKRLRGR
jgi:hypothetical protein